MVNDEDCNRQEEKNRLAAAFQLKSTSKLYSGVSCKLFSSSKADRSFLSHGVF